VQLSKTEAVGERDVPQLLAELRGYGVLTLESGVEQDVPQLMSELFASRCVLLDTGQPHYAAFPLTQENKKNG